MAEETHDTVIGVIALSIMVDEIEKQKFTTRGEYVMWSDIWNAGTQRKHGETKSSLGIRINRLHGEIIGFEKALAVLYRAIDLLEGTPTDDA
jgi:hypothetical protein